MLNATIVRPLSNIKSAYTMDMDEMRVFVANLRRAIERSGWSVAELDRRSGVSRTQISLVLKGDRQITVKRASMLARAFGLSLHDMLDDELPSGEATEEARLTVLYRNAGPGARKALMQVAERVSRYTEDKS